MESFFPTYQNTGNNQFSVRFLSLTLFVQEKNKITLFSLSMYLQVP